MTPTTIDYTKLRSLRDIKVAKEKLRYSLLLREEMLHNSIDSLKGNFFKSLKESALKWGMKVAAGFVMNQFRLRMLRK